MQILSRLRKTAKSQPKPLKNKRKWVWLVYKQHNNLVIGLSLKFKTSALRASALNFNERPPIRLLSYIYKPEAKLSVYTPDINRDVTRTLIGGGGGDIHIFMFCPTSFFSNQIQISQFEKKSVGQNMNI